MSPTKKNWRWNCYLGLVVGLVTVAFGKPVGAQLIPDLTLGAEGSRVNQGFNINDGLPTERIEGGALRGTGLFHSFTDFNVNPGQRVYFANPSGAENIFSRVTGGNSSSILGTLGVEGVGNLFLLNPNGILFGPGARLDIQGSFVASTGDRLIFENAGEFSAIDLQAPPLLTISVMPGLQYGASRPGATIANRGSLSVGQDLTLVSNQLDLQGKLQAGRDLNLQAQNNVQVRDFGKAPFSAQSGRDLTIQGNQGIDILALTPGTVAFQADRNLSLISDGVISGDAHFSSGANLDVRSVSGKLANFTSLYDPVISSIGNIDIAGGYNGASLLIESGGSVRIQGEVNINAPDTVSTFLGSDAILSTQPGLIIRSGQSRLLYGGTNQNTNLVIGNGAIPSGITLEGLVRVQPNAQGGLVKLSAEQGNITAASIDISDVSDNTSNSNNGGNIEIIANRGNIIVEKIDANSDAGQNSGNGGTIDLIALDGSIQINTLNSKAFSRFGKAGDGGQVTLAANNGDIRIINFLESDSRSGGGPGAGNGGAVNIIANNGNILANNISSIVNAVSTGDNGGKISLTANNGNIFVRSIDATSFALNGGERSKSGNGGNISLTSINGNIVVEKSLKTISSGTNANAANGGEIKLIAKGGNISINSLESFSFSDEKSAGDGGAITLQSTNGSIFITGNLFSSSLSSPFAEQGGKGGDIYVSARDGNITAQPSTIFGSFSIARTNSVGDPAIEGEKITGKGGNVTIEAKDTISDLEILTLSSYQQSGTVQINGMSNLSVDRSRILTNKQLTLKVPSGPPGETRDFDVDISEVGQSGNVIIGGLANLTFNSFQIESTTQGNDSAGNVQINSPRVVIFNDSKIISNTASLGSAGDILVNAGQEIILTNSSRLSAISEVNKLSPENILNTDTDVGQDSTSTNQNQTPMIDEDNFPREVDVTVSPDLDNIVVEVIGNSGKAGNISLNAPILSVKGDSQILAETQGDGQGGSITVNAPIAVNLIRSENSSPILSVEASGAGKAGDILINTSSLALSDQARITATATKTSTNLQGGGSITLNASNMNLAGTVGVFAETQGETPAGTLRLNPYLNQPDLGITLTPNSRISASTSGSGNGGDLILTAPRSITLAGSGQLAVESTSTGDAGDIDVKTQQLTLSNGVELSASTSSIGKAGDINITATNFDLSSGAKLSTNTAGSGQAGNINLNVDNQLTLSGSGTGLFASTTRESSGKGGNIFIDPRSILIQNGGTIAVDSQGQGQGGNIEITSGRLTLRNTGSITAKTASSQGGNIKLNLQDILLLRRKSLISATAGTAQLGGDGGNIEIKTPFIISVLSEDNDITANAYTGKGGSIDITTQRIFGLQAQPRLTPFSDITASSELGVQGSVTIDSLDIDPNRGLQPLPTGLVDPSNQIRQRCPARTNPQATSSFVITGRGGLPQHPGELPAAQFDTSQIRPTSSTNPSISSTSTPITIQSTPGPIVEATQWQRDATGKVRLIAAVPHSPTPSLTECPPVAQ